MNNKQHYSNKLTSRENFLMSLLNKIIKEYKTLLDHTRRGKRLKIVEIIKISNIPGETIFLIQVTNKNLILKLFASEIITNGYNLDDFNEFHAGMIHQAAQGKLLDYLKISESKPLFKIISKRFNKAQQQYIFTIETHDMHHITRSADEISKDKRILENLSFQDAYDIGYTQGSESVLKEKMALLLVKN